MTSDRNEAMSAVVILSPRAAAETVCHEEQLRIWAHDNLVGGLVLGDYLRGDLSYDDGLELERMLMRELKCVIEMAFDHPEARTIRRTTRRILSSGARA